MKELLTDMFGEGGAEEIMDYYDPASALARENVEAVRDEEREWEDLEFARYFCKVFEIYDKFNPPRPEGW